MVRRCTVCVRHTSTGVHDKARDEYHAVKYVVPFMHTLHYYELAMHKSRLANNKTTFSVLPLETGHGSQRFQAMRPDTR